jgi:hypothetical protein
LQIITLLPSKYVWVNDPNIISLTDLLMLNWFFIYGIQTVFFFNVLDTMSRNLSFSGQK